MNIEQFLLSRQSSPKLTTPAPDEEQIRSILQAGLRAPDHGGLTPWRYVVFSGKGLDKLGNVYANAAAQKNPDDVASIDKAKKMPHRAPVVVVAIAVTQSHAKVPEVEQIVSTGCGVMAMQQMAQALSFGGMWRTGAMAYDETVRTGLGLESNEHIVGFLYLGTPMYKAPVKGQKSIEQFVTFEV